MALRSKYTVHILEYRKDHVFFLQTFRVPLCRKSTMTEFTRSDWVSLFAFAAFVWSDFFAWMHIRRKARGIRGWIAMFTLGKAKLPGTRQPKQARLQPTSKTCNPCNRQIDRGNPNSQTKWWLYDLFYFVAYSLMTAALVLIGIDLRNVDIQKDNEHTWALSLGFATVLFHKLGLAGFYMWRSAWTFHILFLVTFIANTAFSVLAFAAGETNSYIAAVLGFFFFFPMAWEVADVEWLRETFGSSLETNDMRAFRIHSRELEESEYETGYGSTTEGSGYDDDDDDPVEGSASGFSDGSENEGSRSGSSVSSHDGLRYRGNRAARDPSPSTSPPPASRTRAAGRRRRKVTSHKRKTRDYAYAYADFPKTTY